MERIKLKVPAEIRYISDWKDLDNILPKGSSYIMNKMITGCGYTEYCIINEFPTIICSPRKILLENKEDQHLNEKNVLYLKDEYATFQPYDEDLTNKKSKIKKEKEESEKDKERSREYTEHMRAKIQDHALKCKITYHKPAKFLVTYDSFKRIKDALGESIKTYRIVVDEFQSVFCDARFKPDTENNFLYQLSGLNNICYLSATPMMDEYLEELDEFKDLPYYELDWTSLNPTRVITPDLKVRQCRSVVEEAVRIVDTYKEGKFERITRLVEGKEDEFEEIYSREAVIYINSVKNLCDIIRYCKLTPDNTNVLCSDDKENQKRVREAFLAVDKTLDSKQNYIGKVPKEGEQHKMFTLCTRTVYLGADFYSTNARSFILSDANIDSLSVDISLDLPQILGRQRLDENPWKNYAEFYYRLNAHAVDQEEFMDYLNKKIEDTNKYLSVFSNIVDPSEKHLLAEMYQRDAKTMRYKLNFLSVDVRRGSDLVPVFNKLVMISEKRAFEIQQLDYKNRFNVFNSLKLRANIGDLNEYIKKIYSLGPVDKYKYFCSLPEQIILAILPHLPSNFQNFYTVLGPERMRACGYNVTDMKKEYDGIMGNQDICIKDYIIPAFKIGEIYSKAKVKETLKKIYESVGYSRTPRAVDLGEYFIIKNTMITNKETGKRDNCYYIEGIKEDPRQTKSN